MGSLSAWHWIIVLFVILLLFGGGKVSAMMGDFGQGVRLLKKTLSTPEET